MSAQVDVLAVMDNMIACLSNEGFGATEDDEALTAAIASAQGAVVSRCAAADTNPVHAEKRGRLELIVRPQSEKTR